MINYLFFFHLLCHYVSSVIIVRVCELFFLSICGMNIHMNTVMTIHRHNVCMCVRVMR